MLHNAMLRAVQGTAFTGPAVDGNNTYATASELASHAVNLPGAIVSGNILFLFAETNNGATLTVTGWTEITGGGGFHSLFYKVATGLEGATQTVVCTPTAQLVAVTLKVSAANAAPIHASGWYTLATGSGSTIPLPSVTSTIPNTLFVGFGGHIGGGGGSMTENQSAVEIVDYAPASLAWNIAACKKNLSVASSLAVTFTLSAAKTYRAGIAVIVAPA